ncbi:uncharacterized protein LOC115833305 [Nomascus leucogenys]|uniref:uncharacterized protein LOC115833305 n=1 Tax=Nomascus leucogenys TaxID=61853 RepID=UPI00122DA6B8|nr:uncharacterized protein LOC115833305 [Nomascus leucogenys]
MGAPEGRARLPSALTARLGSESTPPSPSCSGRETQPRSPMGGAAGLRTVVGAGGDIRAALRPAGPPRRQSCAAGLGAGLGGQRASGRSWRPEATGDPRAGAGCLRSGGADLRPTRGAPWRCWS